MNSSYRDISVLLVDDEQASNDILELYLSDIENIDIIQTITDPSTIHELIKQYYPDIIFLDIDMKDFNGLEIAKIIKKENPDIEIIFATGHPEYAFNALEIKPLSYLIKPFGPNNIKDVITRYHEKIERNRLEHYMKNLVRSRLNYKKLKLPIKGGIILINPEDIMLYKSEHKGCRIYLKDGENELIKLNISQLLKMVNSQSIFKTNKSSFINLNYLSKIEKRKRICTIEHKGNILTTNILRPNIAQFEKMITLSQEEIN